MTDAKELGEALKDHQDTITVEGNLAKGIIKIHATGKVAWAVAILSIGVAVALVLAAPATGGSSAAVAVPSAGIACATLGGEATAIAITVAVAGGGVGVLSSLRKYRLEKISSELVILHKK